MSYMAGMLRLRNHNRIVESRRKLRQARACLAGAKGREWAAARASTAAWVSTPESRKSPLRIWWDTLTSHLSPTKTAPCPACRGCGVVPTADRKPGQCHKCAGRGRVRVAKDKPDAHKA